MSAAIKDLYTVNLESVNRRLGEEFHAFKGLEAQQRTTQLVGSYLGNEISIDYQPVLSMDKRWLFVYRSTQSQLAKLEADYLIKNAAVLA